MRYSLLRLRTHLKELGKECRESRDKRLVECGSEDDEDKNRILQKQLDGHRKIPQGMPKVSRLRDLLRPIGVSKIQAFLEVEEGKEGEEEEERE